MTLSPEEAEYILKEIIADQQQRLQLLLAPYIAALVEIDARKPPRPVPLPDGRTMVYCGPTGDDIAGPWTAPEWLDRMVRDDHQLARSLARFRERYGCLGANKSTMPVDLS